MIANCFVKTDQNEVDSRVLIPTHKSVTLPTRWILATLYYINIHSIEKLNDSWQWPVVYMYVRGYVFRLYFYDFSIGLWNCSDGVVFYAVISFKADKH
jgi:hypothetical protein